MKILLVSDVYFPRINGVSTSIATLTRELTAAGHDWRLIAPAYPEAAPDEQLLRIPAWRVPFDPEDRFMRPAAVRRQLPRLRREGIDLVHVHTPFVAHFQGVRLARRLGVPVVITYHTYFEEYLQHYVPFLPGRWLKALARRFSRSQCAQVDGVIVPSTAMREVLEGYGVAGPLEVIPTGLRLPELAGGDGERFRAQHGIEPGRPTLVHVGRLAFEKNVDFLLEVVAQVRSEVPEVLLILAGEGPATLSLRRQVGRLGLEGNVLFVGYLDRERELLDCYRAGDLFVFASRTETQGLVLLEAMALGVPVVSTAVMGTRDIVGPERGAVMAAEEVGDFAGKVVALLGHEGRRLALREEARAYAATWEAGVVIGRVVELYERLVSETERRGRSNELGAPS